MTQWINCIVSCIVPVPIVRIITAIHRHVFRDDTHVSQNICVPVPYMWISIVCGLGTQARGGAAGTPQP